SAAYSAAGHPMVADLNGDGRSDLFCITEDATYPVGGGSWSYGSSHVVASLSNGDGTFGAWTTTWTGPTLSSGAKTAPSIAFKVLDINGDGKSDLLSDDGNSYGASYLGVGNGNFVIGPRTAGLGLMTPAGDMNGDGLPDVVDQGTPNYLWLSRGDGTFTKSTA